MNPSDYGPRRIRDATLTVVLEDGTRIMYKLAHLTVDTETVVDEVEVMSADGRIVMSYPGMTEQTLTAEGTVIGAHVWKPED